MKGMKGQVVPPHKLNLPLGAERKFDGVRLHTFVRDGKVRFQTFNGKTVPLPRLAAQVNSLPNVMLDTEIVYRDGSMKYRSKVSGMINSAMHGGNINERELNIHVFDSMPVDEWDRKKCTRLHSERYADTMKLMHNLHADAQVYLTTIDIVHSIDEINEKVADLWAMGFEGLMLKELNHRYTFTKSRLWAKMKETKTADLLCVGVTEGTGWAEGGIGALQLEGVVEGKAVKVKTGSGLTADDRFRNPSFFIGNTIEMKYNSVTRDTRTGQWSLFLPRYKIVRFDK
jgi:ATP-dependent DNA ligase